MNSEKIYDFLIIGSGPNSAIALHEILNQKKVSNDSFSLCMITMHDNKVLIPIDSLKKTLGGMHWKFWEKDVVNQFIALGLSSSKIKNKPYFGNQDIYDSTDSDTKISYEECAPRVSRYFGGFTNVWGGVLEKQPSSILKGWPEDFVLDLNYYYDEVIHIISNGKGLVQPNLHKPNGINWIKNNISNPNELLSAFTDSYLGIRANSACNECGLCQIGCPYDEIWSANFLIDEIRQNMNFDLEIGVVDCITKIDDYYKISIIKDSEITYLCSKNILLGAGPIGTTSILQRSKMVSDKIFIKDTQTVLNTYVDLKQLWRGLPNQRVTLADATINFAPDPNIMYFTSSQLYFNFIGSGSKLQNSLQFLRFFPISLLNAVSKFFIFTISYFDTDLSGTIMIQNNKLTNLCHVAADKAADKKKIEKIISNISKKFRTFGFYKLPINLFLNVGGGYHFGANLPMSISHEDPSINKKVELQSTSNFGELSSNPGIYVIDASIFPFIPTGSIALLSMANSLRISRHLIKKFTRED